MSIPYTYIYFIMDLDTRLTKIGRSDNPEERLKTLMAQPTLLPSPHNFTLLDAFLASPDVEMHLHERFADKRVRGEWFDIDEEDWSIIMTYFFELPRYKQYHSHAFRQLYLQYMSSR